MAIRQFEKLAALVLIGDGLLTCVKPSRKARAWKYSPVPLRPVIGVLAARPGLTRLVGALQVGIGVWWVLRGNKTAPQDAVRVLPQASV